MNNTLLLTIIALSIYFGAVLLMTWLNRKEADGAGFAIGNRKFGAIGTAASLAAGMRDGSGIVIWMSMGIFASYSFLWMAIGLIAGLFFIALAAPEARKRAETGHFITLSDYIRSCLGEWSEKTVSIIYMLVAILYSAGQFFFIGKILSLVLHIPFWTGLTIGGGIVWIYLMVGGYRTLMRTDLLQCCIMLLILLPLIPFLETPSGLSIASSMLESDTATIFAYIMMGAMFIFASPDIWQRIFSARSSGAATAGAALSAPIFLFLSLMLFLSGVTIGSMNGNLNPNADFFDLVLTKGFLHPIVLALGSVVFAAAVMSTLDSQLYNFSSILNKNILKVDADEKRDIYVRNTRITITASLLILGIGSMFIEDVVNYLLSSVMLISTAIPSIIYMLFYEKSPVRLSDKAVAGLTALTAAGYMAAYFAGFFGGEGFILSLVPALLLIVVILVLHAIRAIFEQTQRILKPGKA